MASTAAIVIDAVLAYAVWEVLTATRVLPPRFFPHANAVVARAVSLLGHHEFWGLAGETMQAWALGLVISVLAGTVVGIVLGSSDRAFRFFQVFIEVMRPVPPVVLIPIALLTLGAGMGMNLLLIIQGCVWIMILQAVYGVRSVEPVALETARSYRFSRLQHFVYVRVPGSLPFIVTGVRICASVALVVAIVAELVGGAPGLGSKIFRAESADNQQTMYALILLTGALGVVVNGAFTMLERRVLFWHPAQRDVAR